MFSWTMELLSNINKIAFFFLVVICPSAFVPQIWDLSFPGWVVASHMRSHHISSVAELVSFPVRVCCTIILMPEVTSGSEGELPGTGVVVVLWLSDVGVSIHGEVDFLQVWGALVVILGDSGALLLPGHFLIDWNRGLWCLMRLRLRLQHMTLFLTIVEVNVCSVWNINKLLHLFTHCMLIHKASSCSMYLLLLTVFMS